MAGSFCSAAASRSDASHALATTNIRKAAHRRLSPVRRIWLFCQSLLILDDASDSEAGVVPSPVLVEWSLCGFVLVRFLHVKRYFDRKRSRRSKLRPSFNIAAHGSPIQDRPVRCVIRYRPTAHQETPARRARDPESIPPLARLFQGGSGNAGRRR